MAVFSAEMGGSVSVNIFRVEVCSCHQECLDNAEIPSYAGYMEGSSKIFSSRVYEGSIFYENFDKLYMTLTRCNM